MLAEATFEGGFPRHKTEAEPILDQRKSARWQAEALTVDTGDRVARLERYSRPLLIAISAAAASRLRWRRVSMSSGGEHDPLAIDIGFGRDVREALQRRTDHLTTEELARCDGQRIMFARSSSIPFASATLRPPQRISQSKAALSTSQVGRLCRRYLP